jgi:hypothetical protein
MQTALRLYESGRQPTYSALISIAISALSTGFTAAV